MYQILTPIALAHAGFLGCSLLFDFFARSNVHFGSDVAIAANGGVGRIEWLVGTNGGKKGVQETG